MDAQPKYKRILLKLSGEALSDAPRGIGEADRAEKWTEREQTIWVCLQPQ